MKENILGIILISMSIGILLAMLIPSILWTYLSAIFFIIFGMSMLKR